MSLFDEYPESTLSRQLDALIQLQQASLERGLIEKVWAELTPDERKALKERILAKLEESIQKDLAKLAPQLLESGARDLAQKNVYTILNRVWEKQVFPPLEKQVTTWLLAEFAPAKVEEYLKNSTSQWLKAGVSQVIEAAIAKVKASIR